MPDSGRAWRILKRSIIKTGKTGQTIQKTLIFPEHITETTYRKNLFGKILLDSSLWVKGIGKRPPEMLATPLLIKKNKTSQTVSISDQPKQISLP